MIGQPSFFVRKFTNHDIRFDPIPGKLPKHRQLHAFEIDPQQPNAFDFPVSPTQDVEFRAVIPSRNRLRTSTEIARGSHRPIISGPQ